jgi:hypothetical protein
MNGIVFAFHYIPHKYDVALEEFWLSLEEQFKKTDKQLILITTTELENQRLPYIHIPYSLLDYGQSCNTFINCSDNVASMLEKWYKCPLSVARRGWENSYAFFYRLFEQTRPAGIISWQSVHPISRIVRQISTELDIPWWTLERGWFPNTLMLDSLENNCMGEFSRSLGVRRYRDKYVCNEELLARLRKSVSGDYASRYPADSYMNHSPSLNGRSIAVFFNHARPFFDELANSTLSQFHDVEEAVLVAKLNVISRALHEEGLTLYIKEHPISHECGFSGLVGKVEHAVETFAEIQTLIDNSAYILMTTSSIQFALALRRVKFGLLGPGFLSTYRGVPTYSLSGNVGQFLYDIGPKSDWSSRWPNIDVQMSFLHENFMLDIGDPGARTQSSVEIAELLQVFRGMPQDQALNNLSDCLFQI